MMRLVTLLFILINITEIAAAFKSSGLPSPDTMYVHVDSAEATRIIPYYGRLPEKQSILLQNQPNPAQEFTDIYFFLYRSGPVTLKLYDSRGREVGYFYIAKDGIGAGGKWYHVRFFVKTVSAGQYYYRLWTIDYIAVKKMIITR
jgi:hypothetical protein